MSVALAAVASKAVSPETIVARIFRSNVIAGGCYEKMVECD